MGDNCRAGLAGLMDLNPGGCSLVERNLFRLNAQNGMNSVLRGIERLNDAAVSTIGRQVIGLIEEPDPFPVVQQMA